MKYLKKFESFDSRLPSLPHKGEKIGTAGNISIFDQEWFEKMMPSHLNVVTHNGTFKFLKNELAINGDLIQFTYWQKGFNRDDPSSVINNGEPSMLEFDIHFHRNQDGIKMNVDITYGDHMACEFSLESPNKINLINYNGVDSKYDPETHFGFDDESLDHLIRFFNAFNHGIEVTKKDFTFLDKELDSYEHNIDNKDHYYTDDSDLVKFGNTMKDHEPSVMNFKDFK